MTPSGDVPVCRVCDRLWVEATAAEEHAACIMRAQTAGSLVVRTTPPAFPSPVLKRPSWDAQHMEMARVAARRSTCLRVPEGVGAVIVDSTTNRLLGVGYAGSLPGQPHCIDVGCWKIGDDPGCHRTVHAEMNALLKGQSFLHEGPKTLYTTLSPCFPCLKYAILMGVHRVVFDKLYRIHDAQVLLCEATGVRWEMAP